MRKKVLILKLIICVLVNTNIALASKFSEQRYRGWIWFEEKEKPRKEKANEEKQLPKKPTRELMEQAKKDNEEFAKELELLKHLMTRYPDNLEYIKLYKLKEKEMMQDAMKLALNWGVVNFLNPDIADESENPQNLYGRRIKELENKKEEKRILTDLSKKVELFVFRRDGCPYCSTLEKHLDRFAKRYGFKVEAITPDNSQSQYFKSNSSPELIKALGLTSVPVVIAVVNESRERYELARVAVSVAEFEEKSLLLAEQLKALEQEKREIDSSRLVGETYTDIRGKRK